MDRRALAISLVAGIVLGLLGSWLFFGLPTISPLEAERSFVQQLPGESSSINVPVSIIRPEFFKQAWDAAESWDIPKGSRILLAPHHIVAGKYISSLFRSYPAKPKKVFLLAPDHFSQGKTVFTTTQQSFVFDTEKKTTGDAKTVKELQDRVSALRDDAQPFLKEHGVLALVPFITSVWPDVPLVPIIVRLDASQTDRKEMMDALVEELRQDPQALLISTVDFSHYQPQEVADFHDILARDVIASLADQEADRVELDSPGALSITLGIARTLGLGDVKIWAHTNSLDILQAQVVQDSTSHFIASFSPGEGQSQQALTLLFVGDMMFDRKVAQYSAKDIGYPFSLIRGVEDRFFRGIDVVIGNFECPATLAREAPQKEIDFACNPAVLPLIKRLGFDALSQANNHSLDQGRGGSMQSREAIQKAGIAVFGDQVHDDTASSMTLIERRGQRVALLGYNTTDNPLDWKEAEKTIQEIKQKHPGTRMIVFMHWGNEYQAKPSRDQINTAHRFIDLGIDAVIGAHPHWMQSVEVYKGRMIAYSLGNFIFDQEWSKETQQGLTLGLAFEGKKTELHLFPVQLDKARPKLLTGESRAQRLQYLSSISDPALSPEIQKGVIMVSK